jgi:hypothetical protein
MDSVNNVDVFFLRQCALFCLDEKMINPVLFQVQRRELMASCLPASDITTNFIGAVDNRPLRDFSLRLPYIPLLER